MRIKTDTALTLSHLARILDIKIDRDEEINAVTTDSRLCENGDLFIALKGGRYDGSIFTDEAKKKNAFVLSERADADLKVESSEEALLKIASSYKKAIEPRYRIAITGSVGKTTTKDFIHTILSLKLKSHKTKENSNNIIGLSYTMLSAPRDTEALICEIGMNHTGEIDMLSRALEPNIAVITNIGSAHIGNLGSKECIAKAKLEIENGMTVGKTVIFKSEPLLAKAKNPYFISDREDFGDMFYRIDERRADGTALFIKTKRIEGTFKTSLSSLHTVNSLLCAIAVSDIIGFTEDEIRSALKRITEDQLRQRVIKKNGYKFYDDSYNSSPEAVIANLKMLSESKENISALLGDMLELGERSEELHRFIGKECARYGIKKLYAFGRYAKFIADGAMAEGMRKDSIFINESVSRPQITAEEIKSSYNGETILVKASHSLHAERIIELLTKEE